MQATALDKDSRTTYSFAQSQTPARETNPADQLYWRLWIAHFNLWFPTLSGGESAGPSTQEQGKLLHLLLRRPLCDSFDCEMKKKALKHVDTNWSCSCQAHGIFCLLQGTSWRWNCESEAHQGCAAFTGKGSWFADIGRLHSTLMTLMSNSYARALHIHFGYPRHAIHRPDWIGFGLIWSSETVKQHRDFAHLCPLQWPSALDICRLEILAEVNSPFHWM